MVDQQNLYTLAEAAERTGLSVEALRLRIKRGKLAGIQSNDGLRVRLTSADLDAIDRQRANQQKPTLIQQESTEANNRKALEAAIGALRERAERAEVRADAAQNLADRRAEELAEQRERAARAEGESGALREQVATERARAEAGARELAAAREELDYWTAGGPLARALRVFLYRRARP